MLSIAKLRVGQEAYQLSGVAQSLDDYYTGAGEAHGRWVGGSAERLDLVGEVQRDDLRAVLAGLRPGSGGLTPNGETPRTHPRRVPGFDLTFKAPKSASVLYAISDDPRVQAAVIDAGEAAMASAIGWLEREAIRVQRGSHNLQYLERLPAHERAAAGPRRLSTSGVVAAAFRHRTSRAGDPLLHWHVLVANLVEGSDHRWSAFAHPEIYRHARAAGEIFQATFRAELTESLGVEWRPGRTVPEIAGIPQSLLDQFSKRSTEIADWLEATGTPNTPEGRQRAVLATRRNKPEPEGQRLDDRWKLEADTAGWGPEHADGLIASCADRSPVDYDGAWRLDTDTIDEDGDIDRYERSVEPEDWVADLLRTELTNDRSTFTLADVTQAVAARQGQGATIETIERLADRVIASPHTIPVGSTGQARWTSRELHQHEQRLITATRHRQPPAVPATILSEVLDARPSLGADQRVAVEQIAASCGAVSVLVGPAGTGKTYTIDTIRDAHQHAGINVLATAPSARAALEISAATGLPSVTLHRLLDNWQRGLDTPRPDTLLIIDEAGMANTRTLATAVSQQVAAGGRVLLVGDHRQLPEVGAGGGFLHATRTAPVVAELTVNRRQQDDWERAALAELRDGDIGAAVRSYLDHDRIVIAEQAADLIDHAINEWTTARAGGLDPILLAGTNDLVDTLNHAAIEHLINAGELDHDGTTSYAGRTYRPGERVVLRKNGTVTTTDGTDINVANGQTGTITATGANILDVALDNGPTVHLDDSYTKRGGYLSHAYALTTHRSQGGTWDLSIAVGADTLYREAAYVQLSRGARANTLIVADPDLTTLLAEHAGDLQRHDKGLEPDTDTPDLAEHITQRLARSAGKQLAHDLDPDLDAIDHLARTVPHSELLRRQRTAVDAETHTANVVGHRRDDLTATRDRLVYTATHLELGCRVSPADRNNAGTVTAIDDTAGTVDVTFIANTGSSATVTFDWTQIRILDNATERELTDSAQHSLDTRLHDIDDHIDRWDATTEANGVCVGDAPLLTAALDRQVDQASGHLRAEQPLWLHQLLGERPLDVPGSRTWDDAVRTIATWRLEHQTPAQVDGIGPEPADPADAAGWVGEHRRLAATRLWLIGTDRLMPEPATVRSPDELLERSAELDDILASAPPNCRHLINQVRTGQLTLDETTEALDAALAQQSARRDWIIEHWPHVVEYHEIDRQLAVGPAVTSPVGEVNIDHGITR